MYATIGEGIRALVIGTGVVEDRMFLDYAPTGAAAPSTPYCTFNDNVTSVPSLRGDGKVLRYGRTLQLELWDTVAHEDPAAEVAIREALNGARFNVSAGGQCWVRVTNVERIQEPQGDNLTHRSFTIDVKHSSQIG